jgi:hypothetical protein
LSYYWKGWSRCWCWTTVGNRACGVVVAAGVRAGLGGGIGGGRSEARAGDCLQVGVLKLGVCGLLLSWRNPPHHINVSPIMGTRQT